MNTIRKIKRLLGIKRSKVELSGENYIVGKKLLLDSIDIMNEAGIDYMIDSGTLLGLVRDGDILPWDDDIDFCIPERDLEKFLGILWKFKSKGWWISKRYMLEVLSGIWTKNSLQSIKIRNKRWLFFRGRVKSDFNIRYKFKDEYYWYMLGAKQISKADKRYFDSYDEIEFEGRKVKTPAFYKEFLSEKYGDWKKSDRTYSVKTHDRTAISYTQQQ